EKKVITAEDVFFAQVRRCKRRAILEQLLLQTGLSVVDAKQASALAFKRCAIFELKTGSYLFVSGLGITALSFFLARVFRSPGFLVATGFMGSGIILLASGYRRFREARR
ncbi:MAG: hypothetical protein WC485_10425, partial [Opitutaceae bacterium]